MRPYSYNGHRIEQAPDRLHRCMKCCGAIGLDFHVDDKCTDAFLDLSPLQKFMGRPRKSFWAPINPVKGMVWIATDCPGPGPAEQPHQWDGKRWVRMYGMDYDFDWVPPAPSPEPEKSPLDKALEDFVAKRKAKRVEPPGPSPQIIWRGEPQPTDCERALDRAMRRLSFHEQDIHTRLMPYRREE